MNRYVLHRLGTALLVLIGISVLTYGMIFLTPSSPAVTILTQQLGHPPSPEAVAQFRVQHGLNKPLPVQYVNWVSDVLQGNLGESYYTDRSVAAMIQDRLWNTVELAVAAMVVALAIALPAGVASAVNPGSRVDYVSRLWALVGVSMPNFWLGYLLIIVGSLWLGIFPVAGAGRLDHLVLPAVTLGSGMAAVVTRLVRTSLLDVLAAEYIRTARAKGLRERIVIYKHALRNALVPVVTIVGLQLAYVLNGVVIIEVVFQRPGLGKLLVDAIFARDYSVVQGITLLVGVLFVTVNLAIDLVYHYLDPRIELGGTTT